MFKISVSKQAQSGRRRRALRGPPARNADITHAGILPINNTAELAAQSRGRLRSPSRQNEGVGNKKEDARSAHAIEDERKVFAKPSRYLSASRPEVKSRVAGAEGSISLP